MSSGQSFFRNKGVRLVTIGWIGFISENLILSHNREYIINYYGDGNYHIAYNILSTMACSSIAYGFFKYGKLGPALPKRNLIFQVAGFGIQAIGLIGLSQLAPKVQIPVGFGPSVIESSPTTDSSTKESSQLSVERKLYVRCPLDFRAGKKDSAEPFYGVERITRHPALWFLGLSCLGSGITSIYMTHTVMFSFPIFFAFLGSAHQDYRYRRRNGGILTPGMEAISSNIPFLALVQGKQSWLKLKEEMKWENASLATLCATALFLRRIRR
jgi:hypothetical protein